MLSRYIYLLAAFPALLLTVLLFMDQQITSVIVNRKEHKLKKGGGYSYNKVTFINFLINQLSNEGTTWTSSL